MKNVFIVLFLIFYTSSFAYAVDTSIKNAGFVPSNIWYSKDPFFSGDAIRVYTIIFNGSAYDLEGVVEFLDNGAVVGRVNFSLSGGGRVHDLWVDWEATEGKHVMTARITNVMASLAGGVKRPITLDNAEAGKSERVVDLDTDGDSVGNMDDLDDDNDGVSDIEELKNGTDPLRVDTNNDGVSDGRELEITTRQREEAQRLMASSTEVAGSILGTVKKVEEVIPEPIKSSAILGLNTLENFRVSEGYQVRLAKENKKEEIDTMNASNIVVVQKDSVEQGAPSSTKYSDVPSMVSNATEKMLVYVAYGTLASLQYFFEWQILFYGALLYLLYRLLKWGIGRWRGISR